MFELLNYILIFVTFLYFLVLFIFFMGLFLPNKNRQRKQYQVSVVVAARNEEQQIGNITSDLINQTYPKAKYEVIIVDDRSSDRTVEIARQMTSNNSNVKILRAKEDESGKLTGKKNALYQGIKMSCGEIILTTDADCRVQPEWVETMVSYFTENVGMVVGFSQMGIKGEKRSLFEQLQAVDFLALLSAAQGSLNFNYPLAATGQNLAYRRIAFKQVGGFDEIGHRLSGDDVLLLQLIYNKTNWKVCFAPDKRAFNSTLPEKTFTGFINQRKRWASNGSYQFKLNKGFFGIVINTFLFNLLLLFYLPIVFILPSNFEIAFGCFLCKLIVEFLIIFKGTLIYNRTDLIKYFPFWFILQIPYVVLIGLFGNLGRFVWKGRKS